MSHEIETMAYAGAVPWHGLGEPVSNDLSPVQMMQKAKVDWGVVKVPTHAIYDGEMVSTGTHALIRESDNKVLSPMVGDNWEPVQNEEAFEFFSEFCAAGDMEMHTAGSLKGGQIVWVLARVNESFDVMPGDRIDNYFLFSNPHMYGKSIELRMTPTRVVCNNTLTASLNGASKNAMKLNHRRKFEAEFVKEKMGLAHEKFVQYKEFSQFLAKKNASWSDMLQYFNDVFPHANTKKKVVSGYDDLSTTAQTAFDVLETQPGADYGRGTWWQALNAVTYTTDHLLGRSVDGRLTSAWFGANQSRKLNAVETAIKYAGAA